MKNVGGRDTLLDTTSGRLGESRVSRRVEKQAQKAETYSGLLRRLLGRELLTGRLAVRGRRVREAAESSTTKSGIPSSGLASGLLETDTSGSSYVRRDDEVRTLVRAIADELKRRG